MVVFRGGMYNVDQFGRVRKQRAVFTGMVSTAKHVKL